MPKTKENLPPNEADASPSTFNPYSKIRKIARDSALFRKSNQGMFFVIVKLITDIIPSDIFIIQTPTMKS